MPAHQSKTSKQVCEMTIHQMGSLAPPQRSDLELVQWIMHRKRERLCELLVEFERAWEKQIDAGMKSEDVLSSLLILL